MRYARHLLHAPDFLNPILRQFVLTTHRLSSTISPIFPLPVPDSPDTPPAADPDPPPAIIPPAPGMKSFCLSAVAVILIIAAALHLAGILITTQNQNLGPKADPVTGEVRGDQDQKHNINRTLLARQYLQRDPALSLTESFSRWVPHDTDGIVNPLWPWLASRLASPTQPYHELEVSPEDRALFTKGKWLNTGIVLAVMWLLGFQMARRFRPAAAITVMLLGTFGALLPRAVYFQPEPLYFVLLFLSWICAIRLLLSNSVALHALFGILAGLAWLAKTSSEIIVLAWFCAASWRWLGAVCRRQHDTATEGRWSPRNHFLGLVAFAIGWLAVCGPRYNFAEERFGSPTHTWPGLWMWMDDFESGAAYMRNHPDKAALEAVPPADRPSLANYTRTHSKEQIWQRLTDGYWEKWSKFLAPRSSKPKRNTEFKGWKHLLPSRGLYLAACLGITLTAAAFLGIRRCPADLECLRLPCGAGAAAMFTLAACLGSGIAYGWYTPIGRGDRFMLSLYLPLVFSFIWAAESIMTRIRMGNGPRWMEWAYQSLLWSLNAAILWRLLEVLRLPIFDPATQ